MATRKTGKKATGKTVEPVDLSVFGKWYGKLSEGGRIALVTLVVALLLTFLVVSTMSVLKTVKPVPMTEERYYLLLSEVDKRRWKVAKSSLEAFHRHVHGTPSGYAWTKREGDKIILTLEGEMDTLYTFCFKDGQVMGFLSSYPVALTYSESTLKSGRALSLDVYKDKLVFYEEK